MPHRSKPSSIALPLICAALTMAARILSGPRYELSNHVRKNSAVAECHEFLWCVDARHYREFSHAAAGGLRLHADVVARLLTGTRAEEAVLLGSSQFERRRRLAACELQPQDDHAH